MNFPGRAGHLPADQPKHRSDTGRVARGSSKTDEKARFSASVSVEFRFRSILRNHQIDPAVPIKVRQRRAALLSIDLHATLLTGHSAKVAFAIAGKTKSPARIVPGGIAVHRKEVLA